MSFFVLHRADGTHKNIKCSDYRFEGDVVIFELRTYWKSGIQAGQFKSNELVYATKDWVTVEELK